MEQDSEQTPAIGTVGPADAVLFDALDARLADLELATTADGSLLATTPDTESVVRLTATDRGLVATETVAQELDETEQTPVDWLEPAPHSDVAPDRTGRTRSRGD